MDIKDFELLVSLGVFNDALMNDAVYKFKRYEDASLSYTGLNRHDGENRGGWDTVISDDDYSTMFSLQQASMEAPAPPLPDVATESPKAVEIPPRPAAPQSVVRQAAVPESEKKQIDTSGIKVGSILRHKAFGVGTVKNIEGGIITVTFDNLDKRFQFPGAVKQGFLSVVSVS